LRRIVLRLSSGNKLARGRRRARKGTRDVRVKVARKAGFCMGVRRALDIVIDAAQRDGGGRTGSRRLSTLGPLIHNDQALEVLETRGVHAVDDLAEVVGGTVVIRAHGAGPTLRAEIDARSLTTIDATCPRVTRCQRAVERAAAEGRQVLIAGDPDHAEVRAMLDFAGGGVRVIRDAAEAGRVELSPPVTLVAQTTLRAETYAEIAAAVREKLGGAGGADGLRVVHSLCRSTEDRQAETAELAREVDAVVVVGGRHSANTRMLAEMARRMGRAAFHVETADELDPADFEGFSVIGVTAGASTPAWVTERVVERIEEMGSRTRRWVTTISGALIGTSLLLALGAASVAYAAMGLAHIEARPGMLFIAFAYMFFAYAANRAGESSVALVAASTRMNFFYRNRRAILAVAGLLAAAALAVAFDVSARVGLYVLVAELVAALYSLRVLPLVRGVRRVGRPRDIPGSKDLLIAMAWAFMAVVLPHVAAAPAPAPWPEPALTAVTVLVLSYSAATALALGDVHSDRLIGRENVAVLFGDGPARAVAATGAALVVLGTGALAAAGIGPPAALGFTFAGFVILVATLGRHGPGDTRKVELAIHLSLLAVGPVAALATVLAAHG